MFALCLVGVVAVVLRLVFVSMRPDFHHSGAMQQCRRGPTLNLFPPIKKTNIMSSVNPLAGKRAALSSLADLPVLLSNYYSLRPDAGEAAHRVAFGTSGHRGNANAVSFNEWHVLA